MELLQLQYFCDTAESENFSKTAKKHLVPTSSVSQSIKRLEKELGCELFDHGGNKITLNNDGRQFYADASQALILLERARSRILEQGEELQGDVHLVCMSNRKIVTDTLEAFVQRHPKVNFIIHHSLDADQGFDVLISNNCPYGYGKKQLIVDEEICVAVNRNHPFAARTELEIADLEQERFITMTPGTNLYGITVNLCAGAGFSPNVAIQTDDPFCIR
ncbi:MAG: LysR family transcriptional regulator, partial [Clostridia bacterium]|nr:LysR family transcriptional regulator [Clostridia bacterium]